MSKNMKWDLKQKNKKVIEHLNQNTTCPTEYSLQNSISLSLIDYSTPSTIVNGSPSNTISSVTFTTDENNTVCVGPSNAQYTLNGTDVKTTIDPMYDVSCTWGKPYLNGTYDKDGNFDGNVVCVYTRPAGQIS
jgi:hypothetical protein